MRVNKSRRRWMRWCRYVAATGTESASDGFGGTHRGQTKAYTDVMYAKRWVPNGIRAPYFPKWMTVPWSK